MAAKRVNKALNARNGPDVTDRLPSNLALGDEVLVWREKDKWLGPYTVLAVKDSDVTLDLENGPTVFRTTQVKHYLRDEEAMRDWTREKAQNCEKRRL